MARLKDSGLPVDEETEDIIHRVDDIIHRMRVLRARLELELRLEAEGERFSE